MDEKQGIQDQIQTLEQDEAHSATQASRMAELKEWMAQLAVNSQYDDEQVRTAIEERSRAVPPPENTAPFIIM